MDFRKRLQLLIVLQQHYVKFEDFMMDAMEFLGFDSTEVQCDIANYLQYGPHYLMVQAQRGEAKSTITAIFGVWCLVHDPKHRILIVSAGGTQANEVATLVTRLILHWPALACLRPDRNRGDRVSTEAFDVYGELKGVDKSPSVACVGITSNLPGKRADLLIADDVESPKNGRTPGQREILMSLTREFSSICSTGRIIYLGTPQTDSSIYTTLPGRGFSIRIWPGRYPTPEQMENYGSMLAPYVLRKIADDPSLQTGGGLAGDQGQPLDPALQDEEFLQRKEQDQGPSAFQLQYMLNTKLSDAERFPLKMIHLVMMNLNDKLPLVVERGMSADYRRSYNIGSLPIEVMSPCVVGTDFAEPAVRLMYVDPAGGGQNGDETAYAVVDLLNGKLFVRDCAGIKGGFTPDLLEQLSLVAQKWKPNHVRCEKNMGSGAFAALWQPVLYKYHHVAIEEEWNSQQKEVRIINTLEPIMARGSLIIDESVIQKDWDTTSHVSSEKRQLYTLCHQIQNITRDRGALVHDDRLDALASACAFFVSSLTVDQEKQEEAIRQERLQEWMRDPMQKDRYGRPSSRTKSLNPYKRRR